VKLGYKSNLLLKLAKSNNYVIVQNMDKKIITKRATSSFIDFLLIISVLITLFLSGTQKTCQQGDWLTCSGNVTYNTTHYQLLGYAYTILVINFIILPLFFNNSIGKLILGLKIVRHSDMGNPKMLIRITRSALNLISFPIYLGTFPFSLIELILMHTGKIDRRFIDKLLGLQVVSRINSSK
jgi:uncharacterized RDD family membrane protein YckC